MKVFYFNDTNKPQHIFVNSLHFYTGELLPQEGKMVEVFPAEDQSIFIKVWNDRVLISIMD